MRARPRGRRAARRDAGTVDPRPARGRAAEEAAVRELVRAGLRILARNVRLGGAEIDIVAEDGDEIVFVEVRSRSRLAFGGPLETIGLVKRGRIARAAQLYLLRSGRARTPARFDVVGVEWCCGSAVCTLVRGAFESPW